MNFRHFNRLVVLGAAVLFLAYAFATDQPQVAKRSDGETDKSSDSDGTDDSDEGDSSDSEDASSATKADPTNSAGPATEQTGRSGKARTSRSVVDIAGESGRFGTWGMVLRQVELTNVLEGPGPFTVFPPTDDAFGELGEQLDELLADNRRLAGILRRHVVHGRYLTNDLVDQMELGTLAETTLIVTDSERGLAVGGARIVEPDLTASNGVIHGIDTVLLP